ADDDPRELATGRARARRDARAHGRHRPAAAGDQGAGGERVRPDHPADPARRRVAPRVARDRGAADGVGRRHAAGPVRVEAVGHRRLPARADPADGRQAPLHGQAEGGRHRADDGSVRSGAPRGAPRRRGRAGTVMIAIVALLVGALVFAATLVVLTSSRRGAIRRRVSPYGGPAPRPRHAGRRPSGADLTRRIESLLAGAGLDRRLRLTLDRAGVDLRAGAAAGLVLTVSAAVFLLLLLAANAAVAVVAALAVPALAALVLAARSTRRSRAFELQLPEILDTLAASLRTGQSFDTALQAMTEDIGEPARSEFLRVITEVNLGRPLETALAELGERVRSEDLQFVLDA